MGAVARPAQTPGAQETEAAVQKLVLSLVVVVAAGCSGHRSTAVLKAEAARRAEILESRHAAEQRADADADDDSDAARAAEVVEARRAAVEAEQASFTARAKSRLAAIDGRAVALIARAKASKKTDGVVRPVLDGANALRADIATLQEKLPAMVAVTGPGAWELIRRDLDAQVANLDARFDVLNDQI
jgi:hypothetical protein